MKPQDLEYKLVMGYDVRSYACGLSAGDRVELRKAIVVLDHTGVPTGVVNPAGEIWTVLTGSESDPGVIWFRQPDGDRHTWDDDAAQIEACFKRMVPAT